jgi:hypothetical protein
VERVLDSRCMAHPTANAGHPHKVKGRTNKTLVWLFPRYWAQSPNLRSGTHFHEMLHLYYLPLIVDGGAWLEELMPTATNGWF